MSRSLHARLAERFGRAPDPLTRRQFVARSLATAAGLMLSSGALGAARRVGTKAAAPRVVVVGGGLAGLTCAYELLSAGVEPLVLEARGRVGGRVLTITSLASGRAVEAGGEFIGSNHPGILAYARRFGLKLREATEDEELSYPVLLGGRRLTDAEVERLYEHMERAASDLTDRAGIVDAERPWTHPSAGDLDARSVADWLADMPGLDELARAAIRAEYESDNGVELERQSLLATLAMIKGGGLENYWTESEVYRLDGGNRQLTWALADELGERVQLGVPVRLIEVREQGVRVEMADGPVHEADACVLATPPSTWDDVMFRPALPEGLRPQMGPVIKHLAQVRGRFWLDEGMSPYSLSDGPVGMTWESTDGMDIVSAAVLAAFTGGPEARALVALDHESRKEIYTRELSRLYPGYENRVEETMFFGWPDDPHARAGYSFPAPGQVTRIGPVLAQGLGRLHFAGEHTTPGFTGYMEGAVQSGLRVARVLASALGAARPAAVTQEPPSPVPASTP